VIERDDVIALDDSESPRSSFVTSAARALRPADDLDPVTVRVAPNVEMNDEDTS
jgi:hypothetical protein